MAITQQLARLTPEQLAACRDSVEQLDWLCSFKMLPESDYLDLDWAPDPLLRAFELAHVDPPIIAALRRGLDGDVEVNPAYRDHPNTVWEHPVTSLEPATVAEVARSLELVEQAAVLAALPDAAEAAVASLMMGALIGHPRQYLGPYLIMLCDFYALAARHRHAVVLWWD